MAALPATAADPVELASEAASRCKAKDLEAAARSLRALVGTLDASLGSDHVSAQTARFRLAQVEGKLGRDAAAAEAVAAAEKAGGTGKLDPKLKRALAKVKKECARAPTQTRVVVDVEQQVNLARRHLNDGRYAEALEQARGAQRGAGANASPQLLASLYELLTLVHMRLGNDDEALATARLAIGVARERGDTGLRIAMVQAVGQLGDLETAGAEIEKLEGAARTEADRAELEELRGWLDLRLGSPRNAIAHLDRAVAGHEKAFGKSHHSTAKVLHLRGDAYRVAGDFPAAKASYQRALAIQRKSLGENHTETASTLNALGVLEAGLGDWQSADRAFTQALAKYEAALGKGHEEVVRARANRALAHWGATGSEAAAGEYAAVVEALAAALGASDPQVAAALRNQAGMEFALGRAERAEELVDRALAAQRKSLGESHPDLAPSRIQRAELLAHRGALAEAATEVDRAIEALVAARGPEHPTVVLARTLRARIAILQGDDDTALDQALRASRSLANYTRYTFGAISDRQRALVADASHDVIGVLLSIGRAPAREVFVALLPHRDSVLRSIAASGRGGGELAELRRRYVAAALSQRGGSSKRVKELAARIDALEASAASGRSGAERDPEDLLKRACERLPRDAVLVKFASFDRTRKGSPGRTFPAHAALVVAGGSCSVARVDLADGDGIERAAEAFATAMRAERADDAESRAILSRELLAPLAPAVGGATRWLVIPDGALWGIPVGVLPDPTEPDKYLFERVTLGYLTSTYELAESRAGGAIDPAALRTLLVGAPDFGGEEKGGPVVLTDTGPCQLPPFEALPATGRELEDIGDLVGSPRTLTGPSVTKPGIETELGRKPWLVHFATHAYFAGTGGCKTHHGRTSDSDGDAPIAPNPLLLSGIVLAGANDPARIGSEGQTGILTAYEVAGLDLDAARLVVLSACDTGTGLQKRGQEVQGLRWGFRAAGAGALVTSLWRSNDVATRALMRAFYAALVSGDLDADAFLGPAALRRAQLAQVEQERMMGLPRPLTWANFIFSGVL